MLFMFIVIHGQRMNLDKSSVIFSSNTFKDVNKQIEQCLKIKVAKNPKIYLGIQFLWGKTKYKAMRHVRDKVLAKLKNWKQ